MFKAIYIHTKPLKHTKNMQILTNYIKKKTIFSNNLTNVSKWKQKSKTPILICCMHLRMDVSYLLKNTKPVKSMFFDCFCYFYFCGFCYFMIFSYKKKIPICFVWTTSAHGPPPPRRILTNIDNQKRERKHISRRRRA